MVSKTTIFAFFCFRVFASIANLLFDLYSKVKRYLSGSSNSENHCEVLKILFRHKLPADIARPTANFIFIHEKLCNSEIILSPYWTLYSLDENYAYFVHMPQPIYECHVKGAPFFYEHQFINSTKLARLTLKDFDLLGLKIGTPKYPVVYFTNTARSGSTLLCQLLQTPKNCFVLSESDVFTDLSQLKFQHKFSDATYDNLLISAFSIVCKNQRPDEIYILKTRSSGTRILPDVARLLPEVKQMFSWRRNGAKCINSFVRLAVGVLGSEVFVPLLNINVDLAQWFIGFARYEGDVVKKVIPKDSVEFSYIVYATPYSVYHEVKDSTQICYVEFADLLARPEEEISRLFRELDIDASCVAEALESLNDDSQANTAMSRENIGKVIVDDCVTEERMKRYREIDVVLGLAGVDFWS